MRHPTEGVLRRLLDEPAGVADSDRRHVAGCAQCLDELAAIREDAALVGAALRPGPRRGRRRRRRVAAPVDGRAPRPDRVGRHSLGQSIPRVLPTDRRGPRRHCLPGRRGHCRGQRLLQIFRTEQVARQASPPTTSSPSPDLSAYGELQMTGEPDVHEVPDAAAAQQDRRRRA